MAGGYLIIERAGEMDHETVTRLALLMDQDTNGLLVILEDTRKGMEKVLSLDVNFAKKFTERIKIPVFTSDELVEFAKAYAAEQELNEIFTRTFGEIKRRVPVGSHTLGQEALEKKSLKKQKREIAARETARSVEIIKKELSDERLPEYLLVDGYNVIFAWDELAALAKTNLEAARGRLMDILCNYQGYTSYRLILVFDAYRVKGNPGEVQKYHNIHVVYTKEAETADMYIEKVSNELGKKYHVTVATSDALEQLIVIGQGAVRMSSRELKEEVERVGGKSLAQHAKKSGNGKNSQIKDALLKALGPGQAPYQEEKEKGR